MTATQQIERGRRRRRRRKIINEEETWIDIKSDRKKTGICVVVSKRQRGARSPP